MSIDSKVIIYKTCIPTYAIEIRPETSKTKSIGIENAKNYKRCNTKR